MQEKDDLLSERDKFHKEQADFLSEREEFYREKKLFEQKQKLHELIARKLKLHEKFQVQVQEFIDFMQEHPAAVETRQPSTKRTIVDSDYFEESDSQDSSDWHDEGMVHLKP
jgi:hypothetical protein